MTSAQQFIHFACSQQYTIFWKKSLNLVLHHNQQSTVKVSSVKNITNNITTSDPIGSKNRNCPYRELGILSLPEHSRYLAAVVLPAPCPRGCSAALCDEGGAETPVTITVSGGQESGHWTQGHQHHGTTGAASRHPQHDPAQPSQDQLQRNDCERFCGFTTV